MDNTTQDSVLDWLLGFDPSCVDTDTTHCPPPNIGTMLHTAGDYTWTDCPVYRGVATNLFETTMHIDAWNADVSLKYYWSDPSKWAGTSGSGISVPIACIMTGSAMDKDNKTVPIDDVIDFMTFFDVRPKIILHNTYYTRPAQTEPGVEEFAPVSDLVCRGREVHDMLPELPTYYEYGSELIFTHTHEDHGHKIVSPRNNWCGDTSYFRCTDLFIVFILWSYPGTTTRCRWPGWTTNPSSSTTTTTQTPSRGWSACRLTSRTSSRASRMKLTRYIITTGCILYR